MTCDVVADLVAQHSSELRLRVEVVHQAPVDVHVATTGRKRVHLVVIENEELEVPVGDWGLGGNSCADTLNVLLNGLVFVETVELDDLEVFPLGEILLAFYGPEDNVMRAVGRIGRAR